MEVDEGDLDTSEKEKKSFVDYIIIGIFIINIIGIFISYVDDAWQQIGYPSIYSMFIIGFIVSPFQDYFKNTKKGIIKKKTVILLFIIRLVISAIFSVSLYQIFYSNNYSLKYTYWICLFCFICVIGSFKLESLFCDDKERKISGKKRNKLLIGAKILLVISLTFFEGGSVIITIIQPQRQVILNDVKIPDYITIYNRDSDKVEISAEYLNSTITIKDTNDLRRITKELEMAGIETLTITDRINYERMRADNPPYYLMSFMYSDVSNEKMELDHGYIDYMVVTSNRKVFITNMISFDSIILGMHMYENTYPVSLSEETVDMIFDYINKSQQ